jgi:hypothetical protein
LFLVEISCDQECVTFIENDVISDDMFVEEMMKDAAMFREKEVRHLGISIRQNDRRKEVKCDCFLLDVRNQS